MALLEIYQGETKRVDLSFTNDDGSPFNLSGFTLRFAAKINYAETGLLLDIYASGYDSAVSGLMHIDFTTGQTNQCPGDYVAAFALINTGNSSVSIFNTEGLRILPSPYSF